MPELFPRFTYSPAENSLVLCGANVGDQVREVLSEIPGYDIEDLDSGVHLRVGIEEALGSSRNADDPVAQNLAAKRLIENIRPFTRPLTTWDEEEESEYDEVFSLDLLAPDGMVGIVHTGLQNYLNSSIGLSEDVARECVSAMAYPFGEKAMAEVNSDLSYALRGDESSGASSEKCGIAIYKKPKEFTVNALDGDQYRKERPTWNSLLLVTIGNCACWGPDDQVRNRVFLNQGSSRLYRISTHNVDSPLQVLSLILGMGVIMDNANREVEVAGGIPKNLSGQHGISTCDRKN